RVASIGSLTGILFQGVVCKSPEDDVYYYVSDHLGTPQRVMDEDGRMVWSPDYLPFGHAEVSTETVTNHFRFPGQYFDHETGFRYNYHRYYDPRTGRYLTPDPIGLAGGINLFVYAESNPINMIDQLGLKVYVTLTMSGGGSLGFLAGEAGTILALDVTTGEVHSYRFVAYGLGLGFGGVATTQVGFIDMDDPQDITGWGLEVSAYAAAVHGVSAQTIGTGPAGSGSGGGAAGAGAGISGMGTYTWYKGKYDLENLPADIFEKLLRYVPQVRELLENQCE
ncbi:MAG: RHS domain-containing protein, partial [Deltaproteobacteria bacterium]|nr:RHS domain-containing protein [Deltaproteobacteria bacterium]